MNRVARPAQVERTSRGAQLIERLGGLWAAVSASEAAEGRAAVEAAMASSAAVHCATLAKVGGRCLPFLRPGHTTRKDAHAYSTRQKSLETRL